MRSQSQGRLRHFHFPNKQSAQFIEASSFIRDKARLRRATDCRRPRQQNGVGGVVLCRPRDRKGGPVGSWGRVRRPVSQ